MTDREPSSAEYALPALPNESAVLTDLRARCLADGVPAPSAHTVRFLQALAHLLPARHVFEIGTGYGLSSLAIATAVPVTRLFTVERRAERAAVARDYADRAGLSSSFNVMLGEGARLVHKVAGPFDLIVNHGHAAVTDPQFDRLVVLLRPGGVLVSTTGHGDVAEADTHRLYVDRLLHDPRLFSTPLPVGAGLVFSVRTEHTA